MSSQSYDVFRFLDLPKELRLMVYDNLPRTIKHTQIGTTTLKKPTPSAPASVVLVKKHVPVSLLATCRTIHDEAKPFVDKVVQDFVLGEHPKMIGVCLDTKHENFFIASIAAEIDSLIGYAGQPDLKKFVQPTVHAFHAWVQQGARAILRSGQWGMEKLELSPFEPDIFGTVNADMHTWSTSLETERLMRSTTANGLCWLSPMPSQEWEEWRPTKPIKPTYPIPQDSTLLLLK